MGRLRDSASKVLIAQRRMAFCLLHPPCTDPIKLPGLIAQVTTPGHHPTLFSGFLVDIGLLCVLLCLVLGLCFSFSFCLVVFPGVFLRASSFHFFPGLVCLHAAAERTCNYYPSRHTSFVPRRLELASLETQQLRRPPRPSQRRPAGQDVISRGALQSPELPPAETADPTARSTP